ncbi:hypothetical protein KC887_04300 [Candidatus Kaiserbacteria bacterium]|nr:hypothetical protein [Candidatus Kaiserbacteria bacterium]
MISRFVIYAGLLSVLLFVALPLPTNAQISGSLFENPLSLSLDPAFPQPGEEVKVELVDQGSVNYGSAIAWYYDGNLITDAANKRTITVTAGSIGSSKKVQAVLTHPRGTQEVTSAVVKPLYLDIVLEPQTYVPPFYLGRAVPSISSMVNATALINDGSSFNSESHFYRWQVNQKVLENGPLRGGNRVSFEMPWGDKAILILEVTDLQGRTVAQRGIEIVSVAPRIAFYEINSLYGVSSRAIGNNTVPIVGNGLTLRAVPYYLDSRTYNYPDVAEWKLDSIPTNNNSNNPYSITLQGAAEGSQATVGFHVRSLEQVLQGAQNNITVSY